MLRKFQVLCGSEDDDIVTSRRNASSSQKDRLGPPGEWQVFDVYFIRQRDWQKYNQYENELNRNTR